MAFYLKAYKLLFALLFLLDLDTDVSMELFDIALY